MMARSRVRVCVRVCMCVCVCAEGAVTTHAMHAWSPHPNNTQGPHTEYISPEAAAAAAAAAILSPTVHMNASSAAAAAAASAVGPAVQSNTSAAAQTWHTTTNNPYESTAPAPWPMPGPTGLHAVGQPMHHTGLNTLPYTMDMPPVDFEGTLTHTHTHAHAQKHYTIRICLSRSLLYPCAQCVGQ